MTCHIRITVSHTDGSPISITRWWGQLSPAMVHPWNIDTDGPLTAGTYYGHMNVGRILDDGTLGHDRVPVVVLIETEGGEG